MSRLKLRKWKAAYPTRYLRESGIKDTLLANRTSDGVLDTGRRLEAGMEGLNYCSDVFMALLGSSVALERKEHINLLLSTASALTTLASRRTAELSREEIAAINYKHGELLTSYYGLLTRQTMALVTCLRAVLLEDKLREFTNVPNVQHLAENLKNIVNDVSNTQVSYDLSAGTVCSNSEYVLGVISIFSDMEKLTRLDTAILLSLELVMNFHSIALRNSNDFDSDWMIDYSHMLQRNRSGFLRLMCNFETRERDVRSRGVFIFPQKRDSRSERWIDKFVGYHTGNDNEMDQVISSYEIIIAHLLPEENLRNTPIENMTSH